ncbi:HAD-IA family hydrolase [Streptomyces purpurogeneiscleroticus]|uniref:HAD-IA family hydrolase n=1 Tax=Streptomyces purpurogeneiscleroticus TaxID=68259 RepID=UPI001CC163B5|nr:HAD-IA family hydrolase [Streptomyces purpurogeneiscleroticus]
MVTPGTRSAVRAVWTDFGGVLTPPIPRDLETFCRRTGIPANAFRAAMAAVAEPYGGDLMAPLDTPLLTEEEWVDRMNARLRERGVDADLTGFGERWFEGREANHAWVNWLRGLREQGLFIGLLSNMPPAWDRHWRRMVPPEGLFDGLALSFRVGVRKPRRGIFEAAAELAEAAPEECVLVDDIEANCAGAEAAGWQAVHFTDTDTAVAELARRLVWPPGAGPAAV